MEFTVSQKLLVHNVLFNFLLTHPQLNTMDRHNVEDIMQTLEESLTAPPLHSDHHDDGDDEDFDDEEDESDGSDGTQSKIDVYVDNDIFVDLPSVRVTNDDDQSKSTLVFFEDGGVLCFELSAKDRQEEVFEDVVSVTRRGKSLEIETCDEVFKFSVSKFPAEWTDVLTVNKTFGI